MRHRAWNGLVAMLLVALMVLGGLILLFNTQAGGAGPYAIRGVILDSRTIRPVAADVTLVEAHGRSKLGPIQAHSDGTFTFLPMPGHYYLNITKNGYFQRVTDVPFILFNGTANVDVPTIYLDPYGTPTSRLTVITDPGVTVTAIEPVHDQIVASNTTNLTGVTSLDIWDGTFTLRVTKPGRNTTISSATVAGASSITIPPLGASIPVFGNIRDDAGNFISSGGVAYLHDTDAAKSPWKRLIPATVTGSSLSFDAYPGSFTLIIDADGYLGQVHTINISGTATSLVLNDNSTTAPYLFLSRPNPSSPGSVVTTEITFGPNWGFLKLWRNVTLPIDGVVETVPYGYLHDTQLQLGLALGNKDGVFDPATELADLQSRLVAAGPNNLTTDGFLTLNGKTYVAATNTSGFTVLGRTFSSSILRYNTATTYYLALGSTVPPGQKQYYLNVTTSQDSLATSTNFTYNYTINRNYERTNAVVVQGTALVSRFTTIQVDPTARAGYAKVNMILQQSAAGQANWKVVGPTGRFYETDASLETYKAIVAGNISLQLSAEESTYLNAPDNRAPAEFNYAWLVSTGFWLYGQKPSYNFPNPGPAWVLLTLTYPNGTTSIRNHTLTVDSFAPTPGSIAVTFGGVATTTVDEKANVRFTPTGWTDKDNNGILRYEWDFNGDKVTSTPTPAYIDHGFPNPGNFTVTLTVVDYAGNTNKSAPVVIQVRDVTKPNVGFTVNQPPKVNVDSLTEGITYTFDASKLTTDNFDQPNQMTYAWTFGDNGTAQGSTVTHAYANYGTYSVALTVTDRAGNKQAINKSTTVNPEYSARPDLAVKNLRLDPSKPQESTFLGSSKVKISVEVTNNGEVPAGNITFSLLVYRQGEALPTPIKETDLTWYDGNQTTNDATIGPHKTKRVEFTWIPGAASNWTIRVTVNDGREPTQRTSDNTVALQTDVFEASWKRPALYGAIVVVVAGIPALFYLRRRIADRRAEEGEEEEAGTRLTRRQRANRKKGEEKEE